MIKLIKDIYDELEWWIWYKPNDIFKTIKCWYYCDAKNPWHWKFVWYTLFHNRPWDRDYIFEVMYYQIQKSRYYFQQNTWCIGEIHRKQIIRWQSIAISLLEIILEKRELWSYKLCAGTHEENYACLVNVNTKNIKRFAQKGYDYENPGKIINCYEYMLHEPHELYINKAIYLLSRIINEYSGEWWD